MSQARGSSGIAEVLVSLSLAEDTANGSPPETALRAAWIAARLVEAGGESPDTIREVALVTLLRYLGCTAYSVEEAAAVGDDRQYKRVFGLADAEDVLDLLRRAAQLGPDDRLLTRLRNITRTALYGGSLYAGNVAAQCDTAELLGSGLGLTESTRLALQQFFERVDGRGKPDGLSGEQIELAARVSSLAYIYELHRASGGTDLARAIVEQRSGTQFDARLAAELLKLGPELETTLRQSSVWDEALPYLDSGDAFMNLEQCAGVFADFADLKSRYTIGHSRRAARLVRSAAGGAGMPGDLRDELETAALLMNIGMTHLSSGMLEKPGPLSRPERDRMELHPHYTERILAGASAWSGACAVAAQHHERPNGGGYHRRPAGLSLAASLLSASDAFVALTAERAYRPAYTPEQASDLLLAEARAGQRDGNAVRIVLEAAGLKPRRDRAARDRFGLTDRENEVLRKIAEGHSNKRVAELLGISARTVQHHSIRIYEKLGVNSRAAATLLASQHGLLD